MINWFWYLTGGVVGAFGLALMLWIMVKINRMEIKFLVNR